MNISKRLRRWPEGQLYPIKDFLGQPVKPDIMSMTYGTTEEVAEKVGKADPSRTKVR
jgi:hypothetical protein